MQIEELLKGLNDAQREAVTHGEGPALVLAGPGSGKTTVIVKRILYLIQVKQIPPEEILVVTFTKDAALSMQQRFVKQAQMNYPVNFGTFHSIFYHILLESNHFGGSPTILSTSQKLSIMITILKEHMTSGKAVAHIEMQTAHIAGQTVRQTLGQAAGQVVSQGYYDYDALKEDALNLLSAMGFYKNTQDLKTAVKNLPDRWKTSFGDLFHTYQRQCKARNGLDFDDMVYECRELLVRNAERRTYWQKRFRYILIDEFQDINPLQYEVVKLLGEQHRNLFAVGDDDQSIYGFRGSRPACLKQFLTELGARKLILNANYRSTEEIVTAAEKVITENKDRFPKQCYAAGANAGPASSDSPAETYQSTAISCNPAMRCGEIAPSHSSVNIHSFTSKTEEYAYLIAKLKDFLKDNPEETCGVLFRTNGSMQFLAAMLTREGIPFQMKERTGNLHEHFIAKDVMAYLKLAAGERSRALFLQIMNRPVRYLSRECLGGGSQVDFAELKKWYRERGRPRDTQAVDEIQRLETQLTAMKRMSPGLAITYICKAVGYEQYLYSRKEVKEHLEEWLDILEFLREEAKGFATVDEWERGQSVDKEGQAAGRASQVACRIEQISAGTKIVQNMTGESRIHLMTVHASKGLEFDSVWMPDCNEKVYPHGNMPDAETVEEERRIFYVGMTRAKKHLELLCTTGTKERPRLMSRFLNPLTKSYVK